jgi:hypothetical protein
MNESLLVITFFIIGIVRGKSHKPIDLNIFGGLLIDMIHHTESLEKPEKKSKKPKRVKTEQKENIPLLLM